MYGLIESTFFIAERKKVEKLDSRLLERFVGVLDAAYWLIGGRRYAQALVMFDAAIEIALKGELERIHRILVAETKSLDYATLKSLLKDAFHQHPSGKDIQIPEPDIERTITFGTAFDRVAEIYPKIKDRWRKKLLAEKGCDAKSLHALRNEIVHYGGDSAEEGFYAACIVEVALPFLEELLGLISQHEESPISLRHLSKEWVYREVDVARSVLKELRDNKLQPAAYAIAPLAHHILWTSVQWPTAFDDLNSRVLDSDPWLEFASRQKAPPEWGYAETIEVDCPICGSIASGSYLPARVLPENTPLETKLVAPEAFRCHLCGFEIAASEKYLAKHFVPIPKEVADNYLKDIGHL